MEAGIVTSTFVSNFEHKVSGNVENRGHASALVQGAPGEVEDERPPRDDGNLHLRGRIQGLTAEYPKAYCRYHRKLIRINTTYIYYSYD